MKKSLVILFLMALAFTVSAQERAVAQKTYEFNYERINMLAIPGTGLEWYQEVQLYVDGTLTQTFNIGSSTKVLMVWGFFVPVGSRWELRPVKTVATYNGTPVALRVYYTNNGYASDTTREIIMVSTE